MVFSPERAMSLMCNGQLDSAIRLFNRALREEKRVDLFALRAEAYYLKGDFERSLKDYSSAIDFEDENPQLYCNRAVIYTKLGRVFYAIAGKNYKSAHSDLYDLKQIIHERSTLILASNGLS